MGNAKLLDNDDLQDPTLESVSSLSGYVLSKCQEWEDYQEANFYTLWDEYYRLWRGIWDESDKTRSSERSRIVTPALQQAVESSVSEVEEATFGHGKLFDIEDDPLDQDDKDMGTLREQLHYDFRKQKIRQSTSEVLINAAVFGTGVAEVVLDEIKEMAPATQPAMDGQIDMIGVNITDRVVVKMLPVPLKNFRIDPTATSIDSAHGCAIDRYVPAHHVTDLQEKGVYRKVYVGNAAEDEDIEANSELDVRPADGRIRLLKYFGLVPTHLLTKAQEIDLQEDETLVSLSDPDEENKEEPYWTEAIVVIANEGTLLKAEANPYMMQDRPVVAFQWDIVPGQFHGRGVCEKGYNSQKALDAEIRGRIDALALTIHPMLAMDASRIPRGHTPQVRPGKMLLTNGKPSDSIMPFNFGNVSQITFAQAAELQKMVQQSTGAVDSSGVGGTVNSEATAAGISMSLGAIIKRQKRTLLNFQECFWVPFVEKAAWRYMQFDPEHYPVKDYNFIPTSTLGIMAREYEVSQLVQLLQTMSPESPMYPALVKSIVQNMNITNREELVAILDQAAQPNPEQQQMQKMQFEQEMRFKEAQTAAVEAQASESNQRANKYFVEAQELPKENEIRKLDAITKNLQPGAGEDTEFVRRLKIAETKLKEKEVNLKEKDLQFRHEQAKKEEQAGNTLASLMGKG